MQKKLPSRLPKLLPLQRTVALALGLLTLLFSTNVQAQTTTQIGTGSEVPVNTLFGPIYRFSSTSTTNGARANMLWTAAEMAAAGIPAGALITQVEFNKTNAANFNGTVPFQMLAGNTTNTALATSQTWAGILSTHTSVINNPTYNLPLAAGWVPYVFTTPFVYTGGALEIATEYALGSLASPHSTDAFKWEYTTGTADKIVAAVTATGATLNSTTTAYKHRPNIKITYTLPTACTGTPTPGTAAASVSNVCAGGSINLTLSGASIGTGIGIQWQSSPTGAAGSFTNIANANASVLTTTQGATTHYRAQVTCNSTNPAFSNTVVVTSPALVSGSFTINNQVPASATNFQTFTAAINHISCGINGPVTFTVNATSGPYVEQIEIPAIFGASTTNTITIQGNGRTISADPVTANRAVIKLDGADFVTINNLNIETTGTSTTAFGWGIHLINGADNNTISNNVITIGSLSTTESNSVGIVFVNSTTSVTTTGGDNGNNNVISGNTIIGGWKGIHLNNVVTSPGNNQITGNTIRDFYSEGIEVNGANGTLIQNNEISRPNRAVVGTFYGVYMGGTAQNTIIGRNRIHNTHGGATALTGTAYGIFSTSNDAPTGSENIARNNLIYNFNGTGALYGFGNTGSDGIFYYNNTVVLDNMLNTSTARGLYQTTLASNIKLINNNIMINTGGVVNNQHGIYLNTATTTLESNRNNLYVPTGNTGYHNAINYLTLANWQTANSGVYDQNSVAADPFFVNLAGGNLTPTNSVLNNVAQPLAAVTNDFTGAPRGTTPDIGAYEFTPSSLDLGAVALVAPTAKNCYGSTEPVTVTVQNFGTSAINFTNVTANVTVTVTGPGSPAPLVVQLTNAMNGGQPLAPGATMDVTAGNLNMTAAGTYTFNATTAVTAGGSDGNAANNAMTATDVVVSPLVAGTASAANAQICRSGVTSLNLTGNTGGNVQWQTGTSATGPFTNIAGATGNLFTLTTPITATTYYQAVISCGTNSATSNVVTVAVNNPAAPTVAPVSRCGAGPVTLTTNAPAGTPVTWYDVATGGAPVATGATFSPNVTATTTFYASVGGVTENVGRTTGGTSTFISAATGWGLHFVANAAVTINSVNVYATGTGTITIKITDPTDNVLYTAQPVTITGATTAQKLLIPVNLSIPAGTYKMAMDYTGITALVRESTGSTYPYVSPSGAVSITAGSTGAGSASSSTAYYWFYDWNISTGCESARTPVTVTVSGGPAAPTITAAGSTTLCTGGSVALTAASTTTGVTYQWFLNGTAIPTGTSATITANAAGTYTAVATAGGCSSVASPATTVSVNTAAATPTITAGGPVAFCTGGSVGLTAASTTTGATYQWFLNGTAIPTGTSATFTANAAGNYTVVATAGGCPSAASAATTITVNAAPATPTITQNGGTLTSSAATGNQWFLNGTAVTGATSQTLITTANGNYTVVATDANGCPSATSAVTNVTNTGLGDALAGMSVQVYPNPATGSFNVKLNGYLKDANVVLYNLAGQQIVAETATADGNAKAISLKGLAAGTYLLKVTSDKGVQVTRLVVQ